MTKFGVKEEILFFSDGKEILFYSIMELDDKLVSKIKAYQSKDGLQNEKGLEKYIDKILTEKAEKE